jgi:hypothetical protein
MRLPEVILRLKHWSDRLDCTLVSHEVLANIVSDLAFILAEFFEEIEEFEKRRRHERQLFVFFIGATEGKITMEIFSNDTKGLNLVLAESSKGNPVPLSKGPFTVQVSDPNGTITQTAGSPDQTTPDNFKPNGTGKIGTVTVTVTDTSVTPPLVSAPASFDVVAPVAATPDTLVASFTPAP